MTRIPFTWAKNDASVREAYCEQFLREHPHSAVHAILYEDVPEIREALERMRVRQNLPKADTSKISAYTDFIWNDAGQGHQMNIYVTSAGFKRTAHSLHDAIHIHEYQHAADHKDGINLHDGTRIDWRNARLLRPALRSILLETRAYSKDILSHINEDSPAIRQYTSDAVGILDEFIDALCEIKPDNDLEQTVMVYCAGTINSTFERDLRHHNTEEL